MQNSISRRSFLRRVGAVGAMAGPAVAAIKDTANAQDTDAWDALGAADSSNTFHSASAPDPRYLFWQGRGWRVLPNGGDDHDNLEWALRNTPSGGTVRLAAGTYKLGGPVVVPDFDGALVGAGAARTTITCADEFDYELWEARGGGRTTVTRRRSRSRACQSTVR